MKITVFNLISKKTDIFKESAFDVGGFYESQRIPPAGIKDAEGNPVTKLVCREYVANGILQVYVPKSKDKEGKETPTKLLAVYAPNTWGKITMEDDQ